MNNEVYPGTRVMVFDPSLYVNDKKTPPSMTVRPATVIRRYGFRSQYYGWVYPDCVDVLFDHRPERISKGHFTDCVEVIKE